MKIVLDEIKKEGVLLDSQGKEVSRYSFKALLKGDYTFEELQADIDSFNNTLEQQEDFGPKEMRKLSSANNIHNWY